MGIEPKIYKAVYHFTCPVCILSQFLSNVCLDLIMHTHMKTARSMNKCTFFSLLRHLHYLFLKAMKIILIKLLCCIFLTARREMYTLYDKKEI